MIREILAGGAAISLAGSILTACVSQSAYNEQAVQLQEVQAQVEAQKARITKMQAENRWVVAGDLLKPPVKLRLEPSGADE